MDANPRPLSLERLQSGGLITNYHCTSRCRHCLYACGPDRPHEFIGEETTRANLATIRGLGCRSIHIGGGEPFLDVTGLRRVLELAREAQVRVEYVETNSSWYRDQESARAILSALKAAGLSSLLISISPFHNEFVPFHKVKGVSAACLRVGISALPWVKAFYREIDCFDDQTPHRLSEYEEKFGADYLSRIPSRYWIHFGGRALATFRAALQTHEWRRIVEANGRGCRELQDVSHFHLDLHGTYIPGLCTGLGIRREDLGRPLDPGRYPILTTLHATGIQGLLELAAGRFGYRPEGRYLSKCDLCFDIRRHLIAVGFSDAGELQPRWIYEGI